MGHLHSMSGSIYILGFEREGKAIRPEGHQLTPLNCRYKFAPIRDGAFVNSIPYSYPLSKRRIDELKSRGSPMITGGVSPSNQLLRNRQPTPVLLHPPLHWNSELSTENHPTFDKFAHFAADSKLTQLGQRNGFDCPARILQSVVLAMT